MQNAFDNIDIYKTYGSEKMLKAAHQMVSENEDMSEEDFLGVQGILMLNGII